MIGKALYSLLSSNSGVSAIVGTRIYPAKMAENITLPCVTFDKIAGPRVHSMTGSSGLASPVYQIDSWAKTFAQVDSLGDAVRLAIIGYRGTVVGVNINGILMLNEENFYDSDVELYRVSAEYRIWHNET